MEKLGFVSGHTKDTISTGSSGGKGTKHLRTGTWNQSNSNELPSWWQ